MKRHIFLTTLLVVFVLAAAGPVWAQMMGQPGQGQGYHQGGQGWSYCPYCGSSLPRGSGWQGQGYGQWYGGQMGPGMMGYGMGPGMMSQSWGQWPGMMAPGVMGPGMMGNQREPLKEKDVRSMVQYHLENFVRNPNLKLGKVKDAGEAFEVEIVTKDDSLVNRFMVDKRSGWMQPVQ